MSEQESKPRWHANRVTRDLEDDSWEIVAPNGFVILLWKRELLDLLVSIAANPSAIQVHLGDSTRLNITAEGVYLLDSDPWINNDFNSGERLFDTSSLCRVIGACLNEELKVLWSS